MGESLTQQRRVEDDALRGCKLLFARGRLIDGTFAKLSTGLTFGGPASRGNTKGVGKAVTPGIHLGRKSAPQGRVGLRFRNVERPNGFNPWNLAS